MSEPISGQRPRARFRSGPLGEVVGVFLRLGFLAFGGPAAHIAMMEDELVERRKWLDRRQFLDLLGVTNLIPGPNSTEMAIHLGYLRAGWPGLIAAGVCFIGPAALIVLTLAWLYVRYGGTPEVGWLLYGIKPVILAVVVQAVVRLGRTALTTPPAWLLAALLVALYLLGGHELVLLFGGAVVYALLRRFGRRARGSGTAKGSAAEAGPRPTNLVLASAAPLLLGASGAAAAVPFSLSTLFWTFLKIGSVLYGSGYVLLAFLRNDFVERLGWLDDRQLLDAIAIGQFTPGPVFTTATFVGYLTGGGWGALAATVGIFLPSFI
ncbi:MAG TPA: chromate efflux transporter, partial [Bacillota bacterium]